MTKHIKNTHVYIKDETLNEPIYNTLDNYNMNKNKMPQVVAFFIDYQHQNF